MQNIFLQKACKKGVRKGWLLSELRTMCETLKLSTKGNKQELCDRISQFFETKKEPVTFLDFVKDNDLESVKKFSLQPLNKDQINEAKIECLNYGYLDMYKYLETFSSDFDMTLERILFVLNKGHTIFVDYLYKRFQKTQKAIEIDNQIDKLLLMFNPKIILEQDNYIKYIELSKMLKNNAELIKQIQLFSSF